MQGKITVQTRLTNSFASIIRGIKSYSPLLVRIPLVRHVQFYRIHEYVTYMMKELNEHVAGVQQAKILMEALLSMCGKHVENEHVLTMLCDCLDEMSASLREAVRDCKGMSELREELNERVQQDRMPRFRALQLHLLNGLGGATDSTAAFCVKLLEEAMHQGESAGTASLLSAFSWSDEELACLSESTRLVIDHRAVSLEWVLRLLGVMRYQAVIIHQVAGR